MTDEQIKYMVDRFLSWKLPENFRPDNGISFSPIAGDGGPHPFKREPSGTNLFDAQQATAMVRHMIENLPDLPQTPPVTENDLYYLKSIQRQLEVVRESLADTASFTLSGMAFADTMDWLDCFIDARERAGAGK